MYQTIDIDQAKISSRPGPKDFDASTDMGFIPPQVPLSRVPPYFKVWSII